MCVYRLDLNIVQLCLAAGFLSSLAQKLLHIVVHQLSCAVFENYRSGGAASLLTASCLHLLLPALCKSAVAVRHVCGGAAGCCVNCHAISCGMCCSSFTLFCWRNKNEAVHTTHLACSGSFSPKWGDVFPGFWLLIRVARKLSVLMAHSTPLNLIPVELFISP